MVSKDYEQRNALFRQNGYYWIKPRRSGQWVLFNRHGKPVKMNEHELYKFILDNPERYCQEREKSRAEALQLACDLVKNGALILDTETTGRDDLKIEEVVETSILRLDGTIAFHSFVHCDARISPDAAALHHIKNDMVSGAPTFPEMWQQVAPLIRNKQVVIWNADFDKRILAEEAEHYHLPVPMYEPVCLMRLYMAIVTEGKYRMENACEHFGVEPPSHRASSDTEAARQLLLKIAEAI